jgi:hypothetical protein
MAIKVQDKLDFFQQKTTHRKPGLVATNNETPVMPLLTRENQPLRKAEIRMPRGCLTRIT